MKQLVTTLGITAVALTAFVLPAAAESVAREAVSAGAMTTASSDVVIGRADAFEMIGTTQIVRLTTLQRLKGAAPDNIRVVLRGENRDLKSGDELLGWLLQVQGESLGLGEGDFYLTTAPPFWGLQRLTSATKQAWTERVQAHVQGDPATLAARLANDVAWGDKRLATDALVDLWHLGRAMDLSGVLSAQSQSTIAAALLSDAGWAKFEGELPHGIAVLGGAKSIVAFDLLTARLRKGMTPEIAFALGEALTKIDAARASQELGPLLIGSPETPVDPAQQLRVLAALRGMASGDTLPVVQSLFQAPDATVRRWALITAGYLGAEAAVAPLIDRLQNGEGLDCHCAAFALHRIGEANGWAEVRRFATVHPDPEVRAWLAKFSENPAMRGQDVLVKLTRGF